MNPALGYFISGAVKSATDIIIQSAIDSGVDVTLDYLTKNLKEIFPDIDDPNGFWGSFVNNVEMNTSAHLQAKVMSNAIKIESQATNYVESKISSKKKELTDYYKDVDGSDEQILDSSNWLASFTGWTSINRVANFATKTKRKEYKKQETEAYIKEQRDMLNAFHNTRDVAFSNSKAFSNSFSDYSIMQDTSRSSSSSDSYGANAILSLLNALGYYQDEQGVIKINS